MKIRIKENRKNILIPIPTGLIFSKGAVWIWMKILKIIAGKRGGYISEEVQVRLTDVLESIPEESILRLCGEIMRIKRTQGSFRLLEVRTADGEEVLIDL